MVVEVTHENIKEFQLSDIVMPMIGHDVRLPTNRDLQQIIVDIMEKDGISLSNFQNQSNIAATSASGSYRRIVVTPSQV